MGPSLPPAALDERPAAGPDEEQDKGSDSESDDGFGPAPPPAAGIASYETERQRTEDFEASIAAQEATKKPQRDEWMLAPPSQGDWSSRVDPTKLKNRKFNTGKGAKAPAQSGSKDNTLWTETPEQKRQRLEDEVMGLKKPAQLDQGQQTSTRSQAEEAATDRRIKEYNVGVRSFKWIHELIHICRKRIEAHHSTLSTKRPTPKRRKMTLVRGPLTRKRILAEV